MSTGVASGRQALDGCSYGTGGTGLGMSVMLVMSLYATVRIRKM